MTRISRLVLGLSLLLSLGIANAQSVAAHTAARYVGTWAGVWTSDDGDIPPFVFQMQLSSDGNVLTTESDELAVSQGVWALGTQDFANLTAYQYSFSALQTPFQGIFKVRAKIKVTPDGEHLTGNYLLEFDDTNGALQFTDTGKFTMGRVHVQPLP